ncbi:hypothetical protein AMAG_17767 [Allomyces macrogynus ATCC 38327]|uniref:Uncharacterized protein n=1 Tax=Allomyces macrogynus (strain ATCC 38327) TaxID=578462 RepID=A0A0L0RYQ8_ALLM3|nr:hypothetical protein AMAG_17767 [Allomyces macrogynus ATCC 38327]|eukprot:KNE55290.1 hypothetical protein AMAG_17767 [Allomyces macrogynus ATCC 38327]
MVSRLQRNDEPPDTRACRTDGRVGEDRDRAAVRVCRRCVRLAVDPCSQWSQLRDCQSPLTGRGSVSLLPDPTRFTSAGTQSSIRVANHVRFLLEAAVSRAGPRHATRQGEACKWIPMNVPCPHRCSRPRRLS